MVTGMVMASTYKQQVCYHYQYSIGTLLLSSSIRKYVGVFTQFYMEILVTKPKMWHASIYCAIIASLIRIIIVHMIFRAQKIVCYLHRKQCMRT